MLAKDARAVVGAILVMALHGCGVGNPPAREIQAQPLARLVISDSPVYSFGARTIGSVTEKSFTVSNAGSAPATRLEGSFHFSLHFAYPGGAYPGVGGTCGAELASAQSCVVVVAFSPRFSGTFEQPLAVTYFDGVVDTRTEYPILKARTAE